MQRDREEWTVAEYLDAAKRGDPTAHVRLHRCAKRLAAAKAKALGLSREDAEDAAQHVCMLAIEMDGAALARVTEAATTLSAWVSGVVGHDLKDLVIARAPTSKSSPSVRASRRGAQRMRAAAERMARLGPAGWARLEELTQARLNALRLHLQGLSNAEIGARLGISRNAAELRIWEACAQLMTEPRPTNRIRIATLLAHGGIRLTSVERQTLEARNKGKSYKQIALERRESVEAVRSRVRRVLRKHSHQQQKNKRPLPDPSLNRLHG